MLVVFHRVKPLLRGLSIIVASSLLIACSGGDDGLNDNTVNRAASPIDRDVGDTGQPKAPVDKYAGTSDISVPDGFDFASDSGLELTLEMAWLDQQSAYLSVCHLANDGSGRQAAIQYDNCLLRSWVRKNGTRHYLQVTNDTMGLIAAIWVPGSEVPKLFAWEREEGRIWVISDHN